MKTFLNLLKKATYIAIWLLFIEGNEKTEWYIEFYSNDNTIHKCARDMYLEMQELLMDTLWTENKQKASYLTVKWNEYINWEFDTKFKNRRKKLQPLN